MSEERNTADTLRFFDRQLAALPLYEAFEAAIYRLFPDTRKTVHKTQISFASRYIYACVSFQRVKRKAEMPDPFLTVTLGLPFPLESDRVAVKSEPYPGRWTTHIVIGRIDEIDDELTAWLKDAYAFSKRK